MASMETDGDAPLGRGEIWLTIYCNKKGLTEALTSTNVCTAEQFEQFVMGFNQAAPLFSIVDVGVGKEAADSKIKGAEANYPRIRWRGLISQQSACVSLRAFLKRRESSSEELTTTVIRLPLTTFRMKACLTSSSSFEATKTWRPNCAVSTCPTWTSKASSCKRN